MTGIDSKAIRKHFLELRDDVLLEEALLRSEGMSEAAQEVACDVLNERLGGTSALLERERKRSGRLWGRIMEVRTFTQLRGEGEPVLGGRDIPPFDGVVLLSDQGLGFLPVPPQPLPDGVSLPEDDGPIKSWWEALLDAAGAPPGQPPPPPLVRLPLSLRATLDPTTAWIDKTLIHRLALEDLDLRVVVPHGRDVVCRLPPPAPEFLERWVKVVNVPLVEESHGGLMDRVAGWFRK